MIYLELHAKILTDPRPWDVEFAFTHTSRELNASSEVPNVFLGHVWYLDFFGVSSFSIGLSLRTMHDLGSVYHLDFLGVSSFPIGLNPRTMQDLGSV